MSGEESPSTLSAKLTPMEYGKSQKCEDGENSPSTLNTEEGKADELKEPKTAKTSKRGETREKGQKKGDKILKKISTAFSTTTKQVKRFLGPSTTVPLMLPQRPCQERPQQTGTATTSARGPIPSNQHLNQQADLATQDGRGSKKPPD